MKPCHHQRASEHSLNHRKLSRRGFLEIAGLTAAGYALASCQGPAPATVPALAPTADYKPVVAVARAASYDRKLVRQQVQALLDGIGGLDDVLAHGNRVAIKTNLTGGTSTKPLPGIPEIESYLTHPEVVRALGELLREAGVTDLFIVEAVYEKESWQAYGYDDIAESLGATLVDLNDYAPYTDFTQLSPGDQPLVYDQFTCNPILGEVDAFISVSKMKCHNVAGVTHSMKNLFGLVPYRSYILNDADRYRSEFHGEASQTGQRVPNIIVDLNRARPVHLGLIDGILTAEAGEGPWIPAMRQVKPGVLFAGKDPVATDAVATAAMGFDPTADFPNEPFVNGVNHLNIAAQLGLGTNRMGAITTVGVPLSEVTLKFQPSY